MINEILRKWISTASTECLIAKSNEYYVDDHTWSRRDIEVKQQLKSMVDKELELRGECM